VEEGLAACVNMVPGLRSIYRWKGDLCEDAEYLLLIKTVRAQLPSLARRVEQLHPYETPELISLPVEGGLQAYVGWVREQTSAHPGDQSDRQV
jgi:periplasmic divalent cation tolerance protein